jgi:hypothetical protein
MRIARIEVTNLRSFGPATEVVAPPSDTEPGEGHHAVTRGALRRPSSMRAYGATGSMTTWSVPVSGGRLPLPASV